MNLFVCAVVLVTFSLIVSFRRVSLIPIKKKNVLVGAKGNEGSQSEGESERGQKCTDRRNHLIGGVSGDDLASLLHGKGLRGDSNLGKRLEQSQDREAKEAPGVR